MLEVGSKAIDFSLYNQNNELISLHDFKGKKVVLYFYPKDKTPGCTKQACAYASLYQQFQNLNAVVIGISKDSVKSHERFQQAYDLPFQLLSDPDTTIMQAYEVFKEKKLYGKTFLGTVRSSYVIDENQIIIGAFEKVKADQNAADMLALLQKK